MNTKEEQMRADFEKDNPSYGGKAWVSLEGTFTKNSFIRGYQAAINSLSAKSVATDEVTFTQEQIEYINAKMLAALRSWNSQLVSVEEFHRINCEHFQTFVAAPQPPQEDRVRELVDGFNRFLDAVQKAEGDYGIGLAMTDAEEFLKPYEDAIAAMKEHNPLEGEG